MRLREDEGDEKSLAPLTDIPGTPACPWRQKAARSGQQEQAKDYSTEIASCTPCIFGLQLKSFFSTSLIFLLQVLKKLIGYKGIDNIGLDK
ncbi:unnamed protein product [Urochloa humidicola]